MGFPPLRKSVSSQVKNDDNFSLVFEIANQLAIIFVDSQSAGGTPLALFCAVNVWQRVIFLKREFSRLFRVSNMFIK